LLNRPGQATSGPDGATLPKWLHAVWPDPFASEVTARFRHTLATGEPFEAETDERRSDTEATEASDWKIERIILPDGRDADHPIFSLPKLGIVWIKRLV